jgi:hypothetical protein
MQNEIQTQNVLLKEAIITQLKTRGGKSSVSCLMQDLRYAGWKRLGKQHMDFEPTLERLGFKIEYRYKNNNPQSWVTGTFVSL